jgi:hypothetical protein
MEGHVTLLEVLHKSNFFSLYQVTTNALHQAFRLGFLQFNDRLLMIFLKKEFHDLKPNWLDVLVDRGQVFTPLSKCSGVVVLCALMCSILHHTSKLKHFEDQSESHTNGMTVDGLRHNFLFLKSNCCTGFKDHGQI